jgi:hypothetical protein
MQVTYACWWTWLHLEASRHRQASWLARKCIVWSHMSSRHVLAQVGPERFLAPEALFTPSLLDLEQPGIAHMVFSAINVGLCSTTCWQLSPQGSCGCSWLSGGPFCLALICQAPRADLCGITCHLQECDIDNRRQLYQSVVLRWGRGAASSHTHTTYLTWDCTAWQSCPRFSKLWDHPV